MLSFDVGILMLPIIPFASFCGPAVTVAATSDNKMMLQLHANTATVVPAAIVNALLTCLDLYNSKLALASSPVLF